MNCGNETKTKKWSSQWTQFMQLRKEDWKKNRFKPRWSAEFVLGFFTQFHKLRSLRRSFLRFYFISTVHIWFISYIINTHLFHGNIWIHNWPAPNVSGFIAQLHGRASHRYREITGSNPIEFFSGFFTQLHKLRSLRRSFLHHHCMYSCTSIIWPSMRKRSSTVFPGTFLKEHNLSFLAWDCFSSSTKHSRKTTQFCNPVLNLDMIKSSA